METASSPRMGADVTPEQQRKHEQLADRARERAVVRQPSPDHCRLTSVLTRWRLQGRRGSVFELSDEYEAKRQQEIDKKRRDLEVRQPSPPELCIQSTG